MEENGYSTLTPQGEELRFKDLIAPAPSAPANFDTATLGTQLLTGEAAPIDLENLVAAPTNPKMMIEPFNVPDLTSMVTIGDANEGKIKVLVIPSDKMGVGKYRSIDPHKMLHKLYKDEFFVEINPHPDYNDMKYFKQFHIVHISKAPSNDMDNAVMYINKIKAQGCKVIVDNDDYWKVDSRSLHYFGMIHMKIHEKLLNALKAADWVTTTTPIFADEIRKFNKNVAVIPNAIDPEEPQFIPKPVPSDRIRIGFLGGSSHADDIALLNGLSNRFLSDLDKVQFVLVGFDLRGSMIENLDNGKLKRRAMNPDETVWHQYENIFTSNGMVVRNYPDYAKYLSKYTPEDFDHDNPDIEKNMPYRRLWTRDINNYARNYNNLDISLAPLVENKFNSFKSQLKAVEAGFFKKALVAQNFGPYQLDLVNLFDGHNINPKGNAVLIDSHKNHKQWYQYIKRLVDNPELITLLGENLYETVKEKFDLRKVTAARAEFYRSIL